MRTLLVSLFMLVCVAAAAAAEAPQTRKADVPTITSPPWLSNVVSSEGNSVLSMECDGQAPFTEIYCHFRKVMFTGANEEGKRQKQVEAIAGLDQMTHLDMAGFAMFFAPDEMKKLEQRMTTVLPEKREHLQGFIAVYNELTAARGKVRPKAAPTMPGTAGEGSCMVTLQGFDAAFRNEGRNRWVSKTGPDGMCNAVMVRTLENTPEAPSLWKFTEERVAAIADDLCAGIQINKPVVFSRDNAHELPLNCRNISFGPW